jgi:hypothetical protein
MQLDDSLPIPVDLPCARFIRVVDCGGVQVALDLLVGDSRS